MQEIYVLVSKLGFSAEYIERICPSERKLQIFYYEEEMAEKKKAQQRQQNKGVDLGTGMNMDVM